MDTPEFITEFTTECTICIAECTEQLSCNHYYHKSCLKEYVLFKKAYKCYCNTLLTRVELEEIGMEYIQLAPSETDIKVIEHIYELKPECFDITLFTKALENLNYILVSFIVCSNSIDIKHLGMIIENIILDHNILNNLALIKALNASNIIDTLNENMLFNLLKETISHGDTDVLDYLLQFRKFDFSNFTIYYYALDDIDIFTKLINANFIIPDEIISDMIAKASYPIVRYIYETLLNNVYIFDKEEYVNILSHAPLSTIKYIDEVCPILTQTLVDADINIFSQIAQNCTIDVFIYLGKQHEQMYDSIGIFNNRDHDILNKANIVNNETIEFIFQIGSICSIKYLIENEILNDSDHEKMFDISCKFNNYAAVKFLIEHGFHGSAEILEHLFKYNKMELVELLLQSDHQYTCSYKTIDVVSDILPIFDIDIQKIIISK